MFLRKPIQNLLQGSKKREFQVPCVRALLKHSKPYKIATLTDYQELVSIDENLAERLEFKRGEDILIVAGYYGDWAEKLSHDLNVHFTDDSKDIVEYVKKPSR